MLHFSIFCYLIACLLVFSCFAWTFNCLLCFVCLLHAASTNSQSHHSISTDQPIKLKKTEFKKQLSGSSEINKNSYDRSEINKRNLEPDIGVINHGASNISYPGSEKIEFGKYSTPSPELFRISSHASSTAFSTLSGKLGCKGTCFTLVYGLVQYHCNFVFSVLYLLPFMPKLYIICTNFYAYIF